MCAGASYALGLGELAKRACIGAVRTVVQLTALGYVLEPIFTYGEEHWWVPVVWIVVICVIAGIEAAQRSRYTYTGGRAWAAS